MNITNLSIQKPMSETNQPANIFAMFQKNPNCYYPCVRIDFTQIRDSSSSTAKGEDVFKKIIPSYNNDRLYFTDAFVLESDSLRKNYPQTNSESSLVEEDNKLKFESKVQKENANMEIQEIQQAEPESLFCQICRSPFDNYIQHIESRNHIRNLQFSKGNKFIKQICKQAKKHFSPQQTAQPLSSSEKKEKTKPTKLKKQSIMKTKKNQKNQYKTGSKDLQDEDESMQNLQKQQNQDQKGQE